VLYKVTTVPFSFLASTPDGRQAILDPTYYVALNWRHVIICERGDVSRVKFSIGMNRNGCRTNPLWPILTRHFPLV